MTAKTFAILAAVAVLAITLALVGQRVDRTGSAAGGSVGAALLPDLEAELNSVTEVEIVGAGGEPVATLRRGDDGWSVDELDGYPADIGKIRGALVALAEAKIIEEKTSNADFYDRLGVQPVERDDARGLKVRISTPEHEFPPIVLGDTAGANDRFARRSDESPSFLIDRDPELPTTAARWAVADIIDLPSSRVQRVEIAHADGERLAISKRTRDETSYTVESVPEGRELQYATIANVTGNALGNLRLEAVARREESAGTPAVTSEFWTFDGLVVSVTATLDGDDEPWVSFSARFDADQALSFATDTVAEDVADAAPSGESAEEEAAGISARLGQWRFRIPEYQYDQMTRRMEDFLKPAQ